VLGPQQQAENDELSQDIIEALCDAYLQSNQFTENTLHHLFHLRDFVYLMRYLCKKWFSDELFTPNPSGLLRGLQRNFNGIHHESFGKLVNVFFKEVNKKLIEHSYPEWELPGNLDTDSFVELIEDRLFICPSLPPLPPLPPSPPSLTHAVL
jgi:hypothetical protein